MLGHAWLLIGLMAAAADARPADAGLAPVDPRPGAATTHRPDPQPARVQRSAPAAPPGGVSADGLTDNDNVDGSDSDTAVAQINDDEPQGRTPAAPAPAAAPRWQWQRLAEVEAETLRHRTLSRDRPARRNEGQALLRLRVEHRPQARLRLVGETELVGQLRQDRGDPSERGTALRINQAHALWTGADAGADRVAWRVGRWLLRDEREWLFDENFDGLRVDAHHGDWSAQALAARVNLLPRGAFDANRRGGRDLTTGVLLRHAWRRDWTLGGYWLRRDDREPQGERFTLLGLRSHAQARRDRPLQHWLELGAVMGAAADGRRIRGWAVDGGGVLHAPGLPGQPRLIVGHAQASGDRGADRGSARDGRYRPTGQQSYEAALGSRIKRKLYGEVLDPDLSNLRIDTLGLGLTLDEHVTLDVVAHRYAQLTIAPLRDTGLRPAQDDRSARHLGTGVDLLLGARLSPSLQLEAVLAAFRPGARFRPAAAPAGAAGAAPTAVHARLTLEWRF
jgi:alginate production protein